MRIDIRAASAGLALLLAGSGAAAQQLVPGEPIALTLEPGVAEVNLFLDVPEGRRELRLELRGTAGDGDLFVRVSGPFAGSTDADLLAQAEFRSVSAGSDERLSLTNTMAPPLAPGRIYLAVANLGEQTSEFTLAARFAQGRDPAPVEVVFDDPGADCDTAPWFDEAPYSDPANPATTLGEARRLAMREAARLVGEQIRSAAPVRVRACWQDLSGEEGRENTLAFAGPTTTVVDLRAANGESSIDLPLVGLEEPVGNGLVVASAGAASAAGTDLCRAYPWFDADCDRYDLRATFNLARAWRYDLALPAIVDDRSDLVGIGMHEILHGIGFLAFIDVETGERVASLDGRVLDDLYTRNVAWVNGGNPRLFTELSNSERVTAMTSQRNLIYTDERAVQSGNNIFRTTEPGVLLYAPPELNPGSTLSHITEEYGPQNLMTPRTLANVASRSLGLSGDMLSSLGFNTVPAAPLTPQRGLYFDRARSGHGVDLQVAGDRWFLWMYTYDPDGLPVWYVGEGSITGRNRDILFGEMWKVTYAPGSATGAVEVPDTRGFVDFSFNAAEAGRGACADGVDRSGAPLLGRFRFNFDGEQGEWCLEPFLVANGAPALDFTGTWADLADLGWGMTIFTQGASGGLSGAVVYYYDAADEPRWAIGSALGLPNEGSVVIPVDEARGFCRSCDPTPVTLLPAGAIELQLTGKDREPNPANRGLVDVTYQGANGGAWQRDATLTLLVDEAP